MAKRNILTGITRVRGMLASVAVGVTAASACAQTADVSRASNLTRLQTVDFQIERGEIVSSNDFAFIAEILGTSISDGYGRMPVTTQLMVDDSRVDPWGSYFLPSQGDVNLEGRREVYLHPTMLEGGEGVSLAARSFRYEHGEHGRSDVTREHISANTAFQSDFVKVLRDGDPAPDIRGFDGQDDVASFVQNYIENGRMRLHENQVIYLFELGTSNLNSSAADFQDLVMIVTLAESVGALEEVVKGPQLSFD